MNSVDTVNQTNVNFTCLKSFKYRRAGVKEQKMLVNRMLHSKNEAKPTLLERLIKKFLPESELNYRLYGIREYNNTIANV